MVPRTERFVAGSMLAGAVSGWCGSRQVRLCVVYGSRARGEERPESDLDLAVWAAPLPAPAELLDWRRELVDLVDLPVQLLVVTPRLDPVLGFQIARDGRVMYEVATGTWPRERLRLWHLYQDSLPFLRAARRSLHDFAEKVGGGA